MLVRNLFLVYCIYMLKEQDRKCSHFLCQVIVISVATLLPLWENSLVREMSIYSYKSYKMQVVG